MVFFSACSAVNGAPHEVGKRETRFLCSARLCSNFNGAPHEVGKCERYAVRISTCAPWAQLTMRGPPSVRDTLCRCTRPYQSVPVRSPGVGTDASRPIHLAVSPHIKNGAPSLSPGLWNNNSRGGRGAREIRPRELAGFSMLRGVPLGCLHVKHHPMAQGYLSTAHGKFRVR